MKIWLSSIFAVVIATTAVADIDPLTSNQDWTVDLANSCVYQSPKNISLGSTSCDIEHKLVVYPSASQGALLIGDFATPSTHQGVVEVFHKAGGPDTYVYRSSVDQNGYATTQLTNNYFKLTGHELGDLTAVNLNIIDTADATGGQVSVVNVQKVGLGTVDLAAVVAGVGVYPIVTLTGTLAAAPSQAWRETSGPTYTDSTTAFGSAVTNQQLFINNNNYVYVGETTPFYEIEVELAISSSNNINAVYQYSTGAGWTTFSPNDGTAGFTRSGAINFDKSVLLAAGWAPVSVNGVSKYYIRIQRTRATIPTPPTESTIFLADGTINQWDNQGKITIQHLQVNGPLVSTIGGKLQLTSTVASHATCDITTVGLFEMFDNGSNKISLCVCEKSGVGSYTWGSVTPGGAC